jgi:hypothetical protein
MAGEAVVWIAGTFSIRRLEGRRCWLRRARLWRLNASSMPERPNENGGKSSLSRERGWSEVRKASDRGAKQRTEMRLKPQRAHHCAGVQTRRRNVTEAELGHHEESKNAHREESSGGVMRVRIIINAPQRGQCQVEADAGVSAGSETEQSRSLRHSAS